MGRNIYFEDMRDILIRPDGENLGGHDPGEAAEAEVESRGEDHQQRQRQPGDGAQPARGGATLCCVVIVLG